MKAWIRNSLYRLFGISPFIVVAASASAQGLPVDETNVLVVIDVTGSMMANSGSVAPGEPSVSRLEVGKLTALDWLINDTTGFVVPEFAVWEFSQTGIADPNFRLLRDFTGNKTQAIAAVGAATQRPDSTPLAGTLCDAVDRLKTYENGKTIIDPVTGLRRAARIQRRIFLVTDGIENATITSNECWGPDAVTATAYPNFDFGSWQWKVLNKLKTGNANTPSSAPFEYIIDVEHILTSFISSAAGLAENGAAASLEAAGGGPTLYSTVQSDVNLFRGLATQSGGTYTQLAPNPQGIVSFRIAGDANDNGCVDMTDFDIFLQVYGAQVSAANPLTIQADFNGDGWVDDDDYMLLIQHWSEGC
jgi:hypothetical protein